MKTRLNKLLRNVTLKVVLACLFIINTTNSFADHNSAMLRIREDRGHALSITINGRKYPKIARNLTVGDLPIGMHRIKIFKYNSNGHGFSNGRLIYQGDIRVKPSRIYYITAMNGSIDVEENCCLDDYGHWNNNDNWENWDDERNCWNNNRNWNRENSNPNNPNWNNDHDNDWNNDNSNDNWNKNNKDNWKRNDHNDYNDPNWNGYEGGMSSGRFEQVLQQVRKSSFESSKLSIANQAIRDNKITVAQMVSLLNEFNFENTKLQFAKDNYRRVVDPKNYFLVNDVFTFESSKEDLNNFLSSQR
jgi:hypothetical protein